VTALLAERRAFASEPLFPNVVTAAVAAAEVPDKYESILAAEWEKVRELRLIKERERPRFIRPIPAYATDVSQAGLTIKNPYKKPTLKNPLKMFFFVFLFFLFFYFL
jgi:hypothetical protein